jgi:hypothetical protein
MHAGLLDDMYDIIKKLAEALSPMADEERSHYTTIRNMEYSFHDYYKNLPEYEVCDSFYEWSHGQSLQLYGASIRQSLKTNRGFRSANKVHINKMVMKNYIANVNYEAMGKRLSERNRRDSHELERWSAIIAAPIDVQDYNAGAIGNVIAHSFNAFQNAGKGLNSSISDMSGGIYKAVQNQKDRKAEEIEKDTIFKGGFD